jgi:hypothetical protein
VGFFGEKQLDYSYGLGLLPRLKKSTYRKHFLPGEISTLELGASIDFKLMQQEALNGKSEELLNEVSKNVHHIQYDDASFDYKQNATHRKIADSEPVNIQDNPMAYLANIVKKTIDTRVETHLEFLPFLEEFEKKLELKFTTEQKRTIMSLFQFGMFLSLIEDNSGLSIQGSFHPSILNCLSNPKPVIQSLIKYELKMNLEFNHKHREQREIAFLALSVGYFHTKYTGESPQSVMEFV